MKVSEEPTLGSQVKVRGEFELRVINEDGTIDSVHKSNTLTDEALSVIAQVMVDVLPSDFYIGLGTGEITDWPVANVTEEAVLDMDVSGWDRAAQRFQPEINASIQEVLIGMERLGAESGKVVWVEIQTNSGGDASGTILATSATVEFNALPTAMNWVKFTLPTPLAVNIVTGSHHIVVRTDYTYSAAVRELRIGVDTTSVNTPYIRLAASDLSWGPYSTPASKMAFRLIRVIPAVTINDISSEMLLDRNALTSKIYVTPNKSRYLAIFSNAEAVDWIREIYLFRNISTLVYMAVGNVSVNKSAQQSVQVYWTLIFDR